MKLLCGAAWAIAGNAAFGALALYNPAFLSNLVKSCLLN
jgi:hypothetical protein